MKYVKRQIEAQMQERSKQQWAVARQIRPGQAEKVTLPTYGWRVRGLGVNRCLLMFEAYRKW